MSKRMSKQNMLGYIGESFVQLELCKAGCSVNNLSFSDYGIDISVQLPRLDNWNIPQGIISRSTKSWEMDLLFAHVQVKYSTKGRVSFPREEVNRWIESSKTGVPTFLFIVTDQDDDLASAYFDPADMEERAFYSPGTNPSKTVSFSHKNGRKFERNEAVVSMVFWARYPLVAFKALPFNKKDTVLGIMHEAIGQRMFAIAHENSDSMHDFSGSPWTQAEKLCKVVNFDLDQFKYDITSDPDYLAHSDNIEKMPDHYGYNTECVWWSYFFSSGSDEDALVGLKKLFEVRKRLSARSLLKRA